MHAGELACLESRSGRSFREPTLPRLRDVVVANVGWIAQEESRPVHRFQLDRPVVLGEYGKGIIDTKNLRVRAQQEDRKRIDFDSNQRGARKRPCRRQNESAGTCARIDDTDRRCGLRGMVESPLDHGIDHGGRCIDGTVAAASLGGAQTAERFTKGIAATGDGLADPCKAHACFGVQEIASNRRELAFRVRHGRIASHLWPFERVVLGK